MNTTATLICAALVAATGTGKAELSLAADALPRKIVCAGSYGGHLQGVATDGHRLYWSFTTEVVSTDLCGRILATTGRVPSHHGDLCVKDGIVYVAVNLGRFNQMNAGCNEVRAYDAATLAPRGTWPLPEMSYGAGGMTAVDGHFFVIGGLPTTLEENYVYEYDADFRFVRRHVLKTGFTLMGIQTAHYEDGRFLFGIYGGKGNPSGVLVCPKDLSATVRRTGTGDVGILRLGGVFWTGRTFAAPGQGQKKWCGSIVRSEGYPENCPVYGPDPTGKGEVKVFYEGRDATGWTDCGYQLAPNGYREMANAKAYVPVSAAAQTVAFPAAGIGGSRAYSVPDVLRGVHRAAACDEVFSLHVPGTPETVADDPKLADTLRAVRQEAQRLGVRME